MDSIKLQIIAYPDAPLCSDTVICYGETVPNLTATGSNIKWFSDQGLTALVHMGNTFVSGKTNIGSYKWYVIQSNGKCYSSSSLARLKIMAVPAANTAADDEICEGEQVSIGSYSVDGHSYAWREEGSAEVFSVLSNPEVTPEANTTYLLTVTLDSTGCSDDNSVTITVHPAPELSMTIEKNPIHKGESTTITASGAASYSWSPATGLSATTGSQVTASPLSDTQITLSGISAEGCEGVSVSEMLYVCCEMCGDMTLFDPQGRFNHGCTDHGYDNNASCSWTIFPIGTVEHIYLYFHPDSFDIKPGDWLRIYDGSDETGTLVAEYNNDNPPPASESVEAGSYIYVRFTSDASATGRGFQARYDVMPNFIGDITGEGLTIYPNPAGDILYIHAGRVLPGEAVLYVYNSTGRLVLTGAYDTFGTEQIKLTGLAPGIYHLRLVTAGTVLSGKFIKQ
jgi:hypothetical protein